MSAAPLLRVENLVKRFPVRGGVFRKKVGDVHAVEDVSLTVAPGETLGLVGESGCGKSTLGRTILQLESATDGNVFFQNSEITNLKRREMFPIRRDLQMIFQDPYSSLNPRMTVGEIVREPLYIHKIGKRQEQLDNTVKLLERVGLSESVLERYPHEFSGGQRQRVGIARALALKPKLIVADEPVSALDVSVQAQVINLLVELQREFNLAYIFISHDLSVVEYISDRVAIMYLGRIVEIGDRKAIFAKPTHPYTRALLDAIPNKNPRLRREGKPIEGETPSPVNPPPGCAFHPRCPFAIEDCKKALPPLEPSPDTDNPTHLAACIRKGEI